MHAGAVFAQSVSRVATFLGSAPPAVVWVPSGGLWPAALAQTLTVIQLRGLHQPNGVTCAPAPCGKSGNGAR